jgi:DNA-binding NarL/FixJ family response regulator
MDAPPVQYVTTSDGYSIAYTVVGEGMALVMLPWLLGDIERMWRKPAALPFLESLARRFRFIWYNARGSGSSSRGLRHGHDFAAHLRDLDALVDRLKVTKALRVGMTQFCHAAVHFAVHRPEVIRGLVLINPIALKGAWGESPLEEAGRTNWRLFLEMWSRFAAADFQTLEDCQAAMSHADYLKALEAARNSDIASDLPLVSAPVLVLSARRPPSAAISEVSRQIAAAVPDGRLVLYEGTMTTDLIAAAEGREPQIAHILDEFVADLAPDDERASQPPEGLSPREIEVLRLIAAGRSNQQIADALVISASTVAKHVTSILGKIGAANRTEAAVYAKEHGL